MQKPKSPKVVRLHTDRKYRQKKEGGVGFCLYSFLILKMNWAHKFYSLQAINVKVLPSAVFFQMMKLTFSTNSFRNTIRVSDSLHPVQARCFVWPDLVQKLHPNVNNRRH